MSALSTTSSPNTQNVEYLYPDTWTNLTDTGSNYAAGFPNWTEQVYQNWYNQPLSTGITPDQQNAFNTMSGNNAVGTWGGGLSQASGLYQQNANYDPNKMTQFLNPYTQDANQATIDASNRNLFENILPNVNSTFTGAGQFGSSRNADFTARAIRDQQMGLDSALAKQNAADFTQANQNYLNWAQQGNQSASGLTGVSGTGSQLTQQDITNQLTAANTGQQLQQTTLDKGYQDWLQQQQFPISGLNSISSAIGNISRGVQPNISTPVAQPDNVSKVLAALQAMQSGLNDSSIQALLGDLGFNITGSGA
jgi:hypothetical protein